MSGLRKRMQRQLLVAAARQQRKETAGHGRYRRPVSSWVLSTKIDLTLGMLEALAKQAEPSPDTGTSGVTDE